jgi:hypothetical protein
MPIRPRRALVAALMTAALLGSAAISQQTAPQATQPAPSVAVHLYPRQA